MSKRRKPNKASAGIRQVTIERTYFHRGSSLYVIYKLRDGSEVKQRYMAARRKK